MSATISALYPPPQSIDSLDQWGSLDGLLWSLDSAVWTTCGVYGMTVTEDAQSAGAAQGSTIVNGVLEGTAAAAGALEGEVVYDAGTLPGSATATQSLAGNRIRRGVMGGEADTAQSILGGCVVNGDQAGIADASGLLQALRIMFAEALGHTEASASYAYALTMDDFYAVDAAQSGDSIFPEYKGWTWRKDAHGGSTWTPEAVTGVEWAQLTGGAAAWDVLTQDDAPWQPVQSQTQPWTAAI